MVTEMEKDSSWPPCPRCHSTLHVHRAGLHLRLQFPAAQRFSCTACGKDKKFLAPDERRHRPGRVKQFRQRAQPTQQPGPPATNGSWKIKVELARSLIAMFRSSHGLTPNQGNLDEFVSELVEIAVIDYRSKAKRIGDVLPLAPKPVGIATSSVSRELHHAN
jgi:hypothetical protein